MQRFLRYLGIRARPLIRPDWDDEQRTLARIQSRLDQLASIQELTSRHASELKQLRERIDRLAERETGKLRGAMTELRRTVLSHTSMTAHALRRAGFVDEQSVHEHAVRRVVDRVLRTGRPVLAGPWTGEVGFELLYWIPFLRKLKQRLRDVPLAVISRGGTSSWYSGIATTYRDVFTLVDPEEFRTATDVETRKQRCVGGFDTRLIRDASRALGLERPVILHPSLMYNLLYPYWKDQLPVRTLDEYLEPALLRDPGEAVPANLPGEYVAARFYFSRCFPDTTSNRALIVEVIGRVASRIPVVLLNTPFAIDDHVDAAAGGAGVHSMASQLTPANNLAVQTSVIRSARGFIGTYGGYSYLAPLCGVPSVTFYSEANFFEQHLECARRTFGRLGAAPFLVLHEREWALAATDLF